MPEAGKGGLPMIQVNSSQAKALISIHAGQVLSYQPVGELEDVMFLSEKAYYQAGKAIKGGAPICWPWSVSYTHLTLPTNREV